MVSLPAPEAAWESIAEPFQTDWLCFVEVRRQRVHSLPPRGDSAGRADWPAGQLVRSIVIGFARAAAGLPTHIPTLPSG